MKDATPVFDPGHSPWVGQPDTAELDAFRSSIDARPDRGHGLWAKIAESLRAAPVIPVPSPPRPTADYPRGEVVYYIRFSDRVKIGTTRNLKSRLQSLPHDEVLATEPGSFDVEAARHLEFAHLRIHGEWFRLEGGLAEHIASL